MRCRRPGHRCAPVRYPPARGKRVALHRVPGRQPARRRHRRPAGRQPGPRPATRNRPSVPLPTEDRLRCLGKPQRLRLPGQRPRPRPRPCGHHHRPNRPASGRERLCRQRAPVQASFARSHAAVTTVTGSALTFNDPAAQCCGSVSGVSGGSVLTRSTARMTDGSESPRVQWRLTCLEGSSPCRSSTREKFVSGRCGLWPSTAATMRPSTRRSAR